PPASPRCLPATHLDAQLGRARGKLREQVPPLELDLALGHLDPCARLGALDAQAVEAVRTTIGLVGEEREIGADGGRRVRQRLEALELRVSRVAPGAPEEHGLSEQGLAPAGDEPLPVELLGMEAPDAHAVTLRARAE